MTPWTTRLLIANVVVFLVTLGAPEVRNAGLFVPVLALREPWRMVTYMFLHAGFTHILFNMIALYFFGPRLEDYLGGARFLVLYFISGIMGAVLSLIVALFSFPQLFMHIVGASGAIYGVMLGFARYWPREQIYIWGVLPIQARVMVIIMTVLSLFGGFGSFEPGTAHFAHLGGFLGGYICLKLFEWRTIARQLRKEAPPKVRGSDVQKWTRIRRDTLHPVNREELDRVLAKLNTGGAGTLTAEEVEFLERFTPK